MRQLPSGTITFVLSDIEGSTRHWQEDEAAMRDALARHDDIVRATMETHDGHVVKNTGDGLMAAFGGAGDAIAAAVEAQRRLRGTDWGPLPLVVRIAVHSGEAHERDGDYFGPTLNRLARLLAAGHGGQILVSSAAAALALEGLEHDVSLVDVGEHRLRDLDRPERVFQACADGLEREFPPLRTAASPLRGFPVTRTRIIGRERLLAEIAARLEQASLVTLTGVGGSGKTRVAIEAGRRAGARLPDGAAFVDLSPLGDPDVIAQTVAAAVGVPDANTTGGSGPQAATDVLLAYLTERQMLVVLDNCEHLIDGSAEIVDRLLAACPKVRVLATSREGLAVEGESILAVPSLELPADGRTAAESEAIQLFVERAAAARAGLDLLGRHESAVVEVCRRLDGIPLALELAAAQLAHFTPEEVAGRLDDRFRLLAGGRRRIQRQATLQAAVDWSYDLLGEPERKLLARLSVFAGGFGIDAAEGVCAGEGVEPGRIAALLASLVAKSLVVATMQDEATRYRLLETIRLYAAERLVERRETEVVRSRHRDWYLAWVERLDAEPLWHWSLRPVTDLAVLEREIDNLRAALTWSEQEGRLDLVGRLAASADALWASRCNQDEGLRWLQLARAGFSLDPILAAHCVTVDGWLTIMRGHFSRMPEKARDALDTAERAGLIAAERPEAVGPLTLAGFCQAYGDQEAGRQLVRRACEIAAAHGFGDAAAFGRGYEGMLWLAEGRYHEAAAVLGRVAASVPLENPRLFGIAFGSELLIAYHLDGRHDEACGVATTFVRTQTERMSEPLLATMGRAALALARAGTGATEDSLLELLDLFTLVARDRLPVVAHYLLTLVAAVLTLRGADEVASTILASARAHGDLPFRTPGHYALYRHYGQLLHRRLGDDVARRCRDAGARLSLDAAADLAREVASGGGAA